MAGPGDDPVTIGPDANYPGDFPEADLDVFEEDRGLDMPSPQGASNTQLLLGLGLLLIMGLAVYFLLFRGPGSAGPTRITDASDTQFTPNQTGPAPTPPVAPRPPVFAPPVQPGVATAPEQRPVYDPAANQREQARLAALQAQREAELRRLQDRVSSKQVIFDRNGSGLFPGGGAGAPGAAQAGAATPGAANPSLLSSFLNGGGGAQGAVAAGGAAAAPGVNALGGGEGAQDANAGFFDAIAGGGTPSATSTRLERLDNILPQGTIIGGILETAINTDLPGMLRAVVSEDIYSFDGSTKLVPRGSRIIGRYSTQVRPGQNRIFIIWERILRPDGLSIRVDSPGTDTLGTAGLGGQVDTHFFKRFGSAILLSVIEGGLQVAQAEAANGNNSTLVIGGRSAERTEDLADRALARTIDIPPTIHVDQGARINIFVSQDLVFDE